MLLLDLKNVERWSLGSPKALFRVSHLIQAAIAVRVATAATDEQLEDADTFRLVVAEALESGLSATELGALVGAAKTTVLRWSTGEAVPRYASARAILARKVLKRLQEHRERHLEETASPTADLRIEGTKVVGDPQPSLKELAPA
jgi:hypothetical protein